MSGRGVVIGHLTGTNQDVRRIHLVDCIVKGTGSYAVEVMGGTSPANISILNTFTRCLFANNGSGALVRVNTRNTTQEFHNCHFLNFKGIALDLERCYGINCYGCRFESPADNDTNTPYVRGTTADNCQLIGCWFEEPATATAAKWFVDLSGCTAWSTIGGLFLRRIGDAPRAIRVGAPVAGGSCYSVQIINPSLRLDNTTTPATQGQIDIRNGTGSGEPLSECFLIGGYYEAGVPPVAQTISLLDPSTKSMWLSNRRWRPPQVTTSENPSGASLHLGDMLSRSGRGLEAWNAHPTDPSWIPLSVNRYANQTALNGVAAASKNRGTMAWVDDEAVVKVWDGSAWKKLTFAP